MFGNNSSNADTTSLPSSPEISLPRSVRFWLMLIFNIPSTICALAIVIYIFNNRAQRVALHNHAILLILMFNLPIQLIDINFYLSFFHTGLVLPSYPVICLVWWFIDIGLYIGSLNLMAFLAIERHVLIFHDRWLASRIRCFLLHYLPLTILSTYYLIFYTVAIFLLPCKNTFDYTLPVCYLSPCYLSYTALSALESVVHTSLPVIIEAISSTFFLIRIQIQKQRLRRSAQWTLQRRLTIQLLIISALNICFTLPTYVIPLFFMVITPSQAGIQAEFYFYFLAYFITFLFPFACLSQYPKLRKIFKKIISHQILQNRHRTATVAPRMMRNQTAYC